MQTRIMTIADIYRCAHRHGPPVQAARCPPSARSTSSGWRRRRECSTRTCSRRSSSRACTRSQIQRALGCTPLGLPGRACLPLAINVLGFDGKDDRIQNTEFTIQKRPRGAEHGSPVSVYLNSVFCILNSVIFAVLDLRAVAILARFAVPSPARSLNGQHVPWRHLHPAFRGQPFPIEGVSARRTSCASRRAPRGAPPALGQ